MIRGNSQSPNQHQNYINLCQIFNTSKHNTISPPEFMFLKASNIYSLRKKEQEEVTLRFFRITVIIEFLLKRATRNIIFDWDSGKSSSKLLRTEVISPVENPAPAFPVFFRELPHFGTWEDFGRRRM
ncbi:hypothetical protein CDAR_435631 [Caerostris darwini]|uniref:Uncharacterized protein n=1 Tax=Caerostris darwini TaxID=1538125 RepID=A0AAV4P8B7_9ARAC|nr:hypothetical protein CDAR_435631 [Caerostris darwini]